MSAAIRAGKAFVEFILDDERFGKQLKQFQGKLRGIGSKLQAIGTAGAAASGALAAGFGLAVNTIVEAGDALGDMSARTGISAAALSELSFAAQQSGTTIDSVEKAAKRMATTIYDASQGSKTAVDSLSLLGVTLAELERMAPEEQFERLSSAIGGVEDPTMRAALAQKVFGRAGTELLPLFSQGADGIARMREQAHALGVTMGEEDVAAAAALDKYRINPGNVGFKAKKDRQFGEIIELALKHGKPVRIGVNWG